MSRNRNTYKNIPRAVLQSKHASLGWMAGRPSFSQDIVLKKLNPVRGYLAYRVFETRLVR